MLFHRFAGEASPPVEDINRNMSEKRAACLSARARSGATLDNLGLFLFVSSQPRRDLGVLSLPDLLHQPAEKRAPFCADPGLIS